MKKEMWLPSSGIILEDAAMAAVVCNNNTLVIAGPGAGKTELLAQKAGFLLTTDTCHFPKKILAISFKKDAANNLKERIIERYGAEYSDRFVSITYDSFFKSVLDRFYRVLPEKYLLNPNYIIADDKMVKDTLLRAGYVNISGMKEYEAKKYATNVVKESVLPASDKVMENFWKIMLQGDEDNVPGLSFSMIAKLSLLVIRTSSYIKKIICSTYSHVFLDEFQDTTKLQYSIVKELFKDTDVKITAVGDNKQRIMLWAGALKTVFNDYQKDFGASEFRLIMNHRSAPRLVKLQKDMYMSLQDNQINIQCSNKWNANDGIIQLVISDDEKLEAITIAEMIDKELKSGVLPNDIAILCKQRVNDYAVDIITALQKKKIRARIETEYQDLLKDELIAIYLDFLILANNRKKPDSFENIISFCAMLFPEMHSSQEKYIRKIKKLDDFLILIQESLYNTYTLEQLENLIYKIVNYCGREQIKTIFPQYKQGVFFDEQTKKFSSLLWKEFEQANNWEDAISGFVGKNSIPIMTIHKSKGLEYSSVYFLGLEDSAFWSFKRQPEEDRCAFFVALSRAKRKITFTFSEYRNNFKYPKQNKYNINEFYDLLNKPGCADIIHSMKK